MEPYDKPMRSHSDPLSSIFSSSRARRFVFAFGCGLALAIASPSFATVKIHEPSEVTRLPDRVLERFERQVLDRRRHPRARVNALLKFIFDEDGLGLKYADDRSRTVAESIADRKANCLSFTLVFLELAKAANFKAWFLESDRSLVWFSQDNSLYLAGHVSAQIKLGNKRVEVNFDPDTPLTNSQQRPASDERVVAHYYNNRAAEQMSKNDFVGAEAYFEAAFNMDPSLVSIHNNRGALHRRQGNEQAAAKSFEKALSIDANDLSALSNLVTVYRILERSAEADQLAEKLASVQRDNPLHHFIKGAQHENNGEYDEALSFYKRASRLDRREPAYLLALERVSEAAGKPSLARAYGKRAKNLLKNGPRALSLVNRRPRGR